MQIFMLSPKYWEKTGPNGNGNVMNWEKFWRTLMVLGYKRIEFRSIRLEVVLNGYIILSGQ